MSACRSQIVGALELLGWLIKTYGPEPLASPPRLSCRSYMYCWGTQTAGLTASVRIMAKTILYA